MWAAFQEGPDALGNSLRGLEAVPPVILRSLQFFLDQPVMEIAHHAVDRGEIF